MSEDRLLSLTEVETMVCAKKSTIYNAISAGTFPAPVSLDKKQKRWRLSDVQTWIASRADAWKPEGAA